jgi:hypothetical protein
LHCDYSSCVSDATVVESADDRVKIHDVRANIFRFVTQSMDASRISRIDPCDIDLHYLRATSWARKVSMHRHEIAGLESGFLPALPTHHFIERLAGLHDARDELHQPRRMILVQRTHSKMLHQDDSAALGIVR